MNTNNNEGYTITDLFVLKSLLEIVNNSKENLEWVLQKQNQLRVEYLTFFKKDLKEIQSSLNELTNTNNSIVEAIIKEYREDILKSFAIVDVRYQKVLTIEQTIDKVISSISDDMKKYTEEKNEQLQKIKSITSELERLTPDNEVPIDKDSIIKLVIQLKQTINTDEQQ